MVKIPKHIEMVGKKRKKFFGTFPSKTTSYFNVGTSSFVAGWSPFSILPLC
jgi:hypothetical protein